MKTAKLILQSKSTTDAYNVIAQLNNLAANKNPESVPFSKFLHAAIKTGTTEFQVTLVNCTKKEAIIALRDILRMYKCFNLSGKLLCYNPLIKQEEKIISLPIDFDSPSGPEALDKLNNTLHTKFTEEDLII